MAPNKPDADDFINVWMDGEPGRPGAATAKSGNEFFDKWHAQSSAKLAIPPVTGAEALRAIYPNHSLVMTNGYTMGIISFPAATITPIEKSPLLTNLNFVPLPRVGEVPGVLVDSVEFGAFKITWTSYEYIMYIVHYPQGLGTVTQYFILHEGPEEVSRLFLLAAGSFTNALHDEIWVYDQNAYWRKDHSLWVEVQKANWDDVILDEEFKKALKKDVYGFFESKEIYKELSIPWKRGLIMYGPPGNGKTISLKTIMKECGALGYAPLYVKTFKTWKGEEASMDDVFTKARQLAPCVMILEDLDSLINDQNRSFFLNQLDGLEGNDGLLLIGTTNHFDRLDPGLSSRPSRFDRKYNFEDPNEHERTLYVQYWQKKLKSNKDVEFPDSLVARIAQATDRFSFAYLKEAFVSALVTLVGVEGPKPTFESVIMKQIDVLRKQLDKQLTGSARSWQLEDSNEHGDSAHGRGHRHRDEHGHGHGHAHGHTHSHGHGHGHGRSARRGGDAAPSARAGMPRAYTGAGSAFIDDEMRGLLDTRVDAARTRLYRARFGADSVLRPDQGPPPPQSLFNNVGVNGASTTSRSGGGGGGIGDVRDLLDSLSDSLASEGDASSTSSTVTQRRFYDGVVPATAPPRLNLDVGSTEFGMPEQPSSAQWARGAPGGTGFRGLPGGW